MVLEQRQQYDILIVDDDVDICEVLKQYCMNMGCFKNIILAHDGIVANQKLRNQRFSVILLDMNLPKKSGLDVLNEFNDHSVNKKDSILVVSGALEKELIGKALRSGVKNFLAKPFTEDAFHEKVLKIIAQLKS